MPGRGDTRVTKIEMVPALMGFTFCLWPKIARKCGNMASTAGQRHSY